MATITLASLDDRFPDGTTLAAYLAEAKRDGQAPSGTAVATTATSGGRVTFGGLAERARYVAYAQVGGVHRYLHFATFDSPAATEAAASSANAALDFVGSSSTLLKDGIWTWYSNPRALCYAGTRRKMYVGTVTGNGHVLISSLDLDTGEREETFLRTASVVDDHDNCSMVMRSDGRLLVFSANHSTDNLLRYYIATDPESVRSFGAEQTVAGAATVSYVNPYRLAMEGRIYVFSRMAAGDGAWSPHMVSSTDDGATWSAKVEVFRGDGASRPYLQYTSNDTDRIHFFASFGHPREVAAGQNHLYHWYMQGGNLYKSDGTLIRSVASLSTTGPLGPSEVTKVYDATADKGAAVNGNGWTWSIALDGNGNPVCTHSIYSAVRDNHYVVAWWTGTAWARKVLLTGQRSLSNKTDDTSSAVAGENEPQYTGGLTVDPRDTRRVYMSRYINGQWEIQRWSTTDQWATRTIEPITEDSTYLQIRPVVPRNWLPGAPVVLWASGTFSTFYDFATQIKAAPKTPNLGRTPTGYGAHWAGAWSIWDSKQALAALADGAAISSFPDRSGYGRDLVQATGAKQPTKQTVFGVPVARFASGNVLSLVGPLPPGNDIPDVGVPVPAPRLSIFAVAKITSGSGSVVATRNTAWGWIFRLLAAGSTLFGRITYPPNATYTVTTTSWQVHEVISDGLSVQIGANGTLAAPVNPANYALPPTYRIDMGAEAATTTDLPDGSPFIGDIAFVALFDSIKTLADRQAIEADLAALVADLNA